MLYCRPEQQACSGPCTYRNQAYDLMSHSVVPVLGRLLVELVRINPNPIVWFRKLDSESNYDLQEVRDFDSEPAAMITVYSYRCLRLNFQHHQYYSPGTEYIDQVQFDQ